MILAVFVMDFLGYGRTFYAIRGVCESPALLKSIVCSVFGYEVLAFQTMFGRCGFGYEVSSVVLFFVRPCLNTSLRGSRELALASAFGIDLPDTYKINSTAHGRPGRSIIGNTPERNARSRGHIEPAGSRGIRRLRQRINTVTSFEWFLPCTGFVSC